MLWHLGHVYNHYFYFVFSRSGFSIFFSFSFLVGLEVWCRSQLESTEPRNCEQPTDSYEILKMLWCSNYEYASKCTRRQSEYRWNSYLRDTECSHPGYTNRMWYILMIFNSRRVCVAQWFHYFKYIINLILN